MGKNKHGKRKKSSGTDSEHSNKSAKHGESPAAVIICANTRPTLNDVTFQELTILLKRVASICPVISVAVGQGRLRVMESGQGSPCLDLRLIDEDLVEKLKSECTDLIVIEGMGRAIHTNFNAPFNCDSLKVAV